MIGQDRIHPSLAFFHRSRAGWNQWTSLGLLIVAWTIYRRLYPWERGRAFSQEKREFVCLVYVSFPQLLSWGNVKRFSVVKVSWRWPQLLWFQDGDNHVMARWQSSTLLNRMICVCVHMWCEHVLWIFPPSYSILYCFVFIQGLTMQLWL